MQDLKSEKRAARRLIRAQIAALNEKELEKSDEAIYNNLSVLPELQAAERVFLYLSIRREVDTRRLLFRLLEQGKTAALPVSLSEGRMYFAEYRPDGLTEGSVVPIPEPDEYAPQLEPQEGDLILVPALTFDLAGYRLGQGGGYYDRFLSAHSLFSVGLARDALIMDEVPREAHDCAVSCLVTESRVIRF